MKISKKQSILNFLTVEKVLEFEEAAEPSAIAYEAYLKKNEKVVFHYFERVYNKLKLEHKL